MITSRVGSMKEVYQKVKDLETVERAQMLTGPYDVMALAEADEITKITNELIEKLRMIDGVEDTVTNIYIE